MNDYWNDPPDHPEPPACPNDKPICDGLGEYLYDGQTGMVFSCDTCAYQWVIPFPVEWSDEHCNDFGEKPGDEPKPCPHGRMDQCDACDYLSDIAYDIDRERRIFGK